MEQIAKAIYDWCIENEMWQYVSIYFDGKAWSSYKRWGGEEGRRIGDRLFEYEDKTRWTISSMPTPPRSR